MGKETKIKANQKVINFKAKTEGLKESSSQSQKDDTIARAYEILNSLEVWRSLVQEVEFAKTLDDLMKSKGISETRSLSACMLDNFLKKKLHLTRDIWEKNTKVSSKAGVFGKTEDKSPDNSTMERFSFLLFPIISDIIEALYAKNSSEDRSEIDTDAIKPYYVMEQSDISWLLMWIFKLGKSVLHLTVNQSISSCRKIT